jgi:hypothetical protein
VSIKNPPMTTDLAPKISSKFARLDNIFAEDITNNRSPQPTASVASARKATKRKKLHSSKGRRKTIATARTSRGNKTPQP